MLASTEEGSTLLVEDETFGMFENVFSESEQDSLSELLTSEYLSISLGASRLSFGTRLFLLASLLDLSSKSTISSGMLRVFLVLREIVFSSPGGLISQLVTRESVAFFFPFLFLAPKYLTLALVLTEPLELGLEVSAKLRTLLTAFGLIILKLRL